MTVAPLRPYQHAYDPGKDPFELVDTIAGGPRVERWRADAMLLGETSGLLQVRQQIRNDAVAALDEIEQRERVVAEREARCDQRERRVADAAARVSGLADRAAAEWDRVQQARTDQERKTKPLAHPPDQPADPPPNQPADPAPGADAEPEPPLHSILAKQNLDPVELDAGGTQVSVPLSDVHSRDQVEFPDPQLARPPVLQQPVAAGLDRARPE